MSLAPDPVEVVRGDSPVILGLPHTGTWLPDDILARLNERGVPAWVMGQVGQASGEDTDGPDYVQGAKGVDGGAVRLVGAYAS